jgi:hypothetical protein
VSDEEEEGTGHNFCTSCNQHFTDVLWQYKSEYAKKFANKSGASRVENQIFEFE